MALPAGSPAIDAIPTSTPGCAGTTDQRGIARPQGNGCDIGAYELVVTSGDTQPPSVPTGLAITSVTSSSVSLSWNASSDNVGVTGYTIYRNGAPVGSTGGPAATTFTDLTASPNTSYSYTVDAFDGSGNHSGRSAPVSVHHAGSDGSPGCPGRRHRHGHPGDQYHHRAGQPGPRRRSAGRLAGPVRRRRAGAGLRQRERTVDPDQRVDDLLQRRRGSRPLLPAELGTGPVRSDHHHHGDQCRRTSKVRSPSTAVWPRPAPSTRWRRPRETARRSIRGRPLRSGRGNWWSAASSPADRPGR